MMFLGFVELGETIKGLAQVRNSARTPQNGDSLPAFRVYGPDGIMENGTGTCTKKDSGTVTGATNASPIEITSAGHGLSTGARVTIADVGGNTAANGTFTITRTGENTFTLDGSTGNGAYTSGGTWHVTGLYEFSIDATSANGYEAGLTYTVLVSTEISSTAWSETFTFTVA